MADAELATAFRKNLARHGARIRRALAMRAALGGAAAGGVVAGACALSLWLWARHLELRAPVAVGLVIVFAIAGVLRGRRAAWSDAKVALFLDRELSAREHVVTAEELTREGAPDPTVLRPALEALRGKTPAMRILRRRHVPQGVAMAAGIASAVVFSWLPVGRAVATPPPVGATLARPEATPGLDKVIALANTPPRDEAERERLAKIARDAEKLKADLLKGLEQREALDRVAKLEEALEQERLSLGAGEKRHGLEAAQARLDERSVTKKAARALGDHDLQTLDAEMERIANSQEAEDRKAAKKALEEAIQAARKNGAKDVEKALQDQRDRFDEREKRAELLRELESAMRDAGQSGGKSDRESLDRKGSDQAAKKLADAMAKALAKMTPEQRKKLAENLAKLSQKGGSGAPGDDKDLAKKLATPEGQKELEKQLEDLAKQDLESPEAKKDGALDDAQGGLGDTKKQLGGVVPMPSPGGHGGKPGSGSGKDGSGSPGSHHDTGTGDHTGATPAIAGDTLRSRARGPMNRGAPMPGTVTMWTEGKAGGTAVTPRTGDLKAAGATELDGVERSDVPTEYREQLRQYFQP